MKQISTDNWNILGDERIRRWPGSFGGKRNIKVELHSWVGVSPGARHIDVYVDEEDNQWWCEAENAWVSIYSDSSAKGYHMKASVYTEDEANSIADSFVKLITSSDNNTEYEIQRS